MEASEELQRIYVFGKVRYCTCTVHVCMYPVLGSELKFLQRSPADIV